MRLDNKLSKNKTHKSSNICWIVNEQIISKKSQKFKKNGLIQTKRHRKSIGIVSSESLSLEYKITIENGKIAKQVGFYSTRNNLEPVIFEITI